MMDFRNGVATMLDFSVVKKIGEGNYLSDDQFTIERARKRRALGTGRSRVEPKNRMKALLKYARLRTS